MLARPSGRWQTCPCPRSEREIGDRHHRPDDKRAEAETCHFSTPACYETDDAIDVNTNDGWRERFRPESTIPSRCCSPFSSVRCLYDWVVNVLIRQATPEDIDQVLTLWSDAETEQGPTDDEPGLGDLLVRDAGSLLVATSENGRVVGSVIAAWDGWRGSIYRLAVHPRYRRRGLANQLLSAAEDRLAALGARRVQAIVVASDERATGFWRSTAWNEQVERLRFVKG